MSNQFFTEFPVSSGLNHDNFLEIFLRWISGIVDSDIKIKRVLADSENNGDFETKTESGETLKYSIVDFGGEQTAGVQHDLPDRSGRIWRTEAILSSAENQSHLSVRTSCITDGFSGHITTPKRPVLIKQIISDAFGGFDGDLLVSDSPHYISEKEIEKAKRAVLGGASVSLPIVYISSKSDDSIAIDADQLAYELGGLAHVLVEPDRNFSFLLRDETESRNPYAGAIGIARPGSPISAKIFPNRGDKKTREDIIGYIQNVFLGRVAVHGKEWSDLQQDLIKSARQRLQEQQRGEDDETGLDEWIDSFEEEIREKDGQLSKLRSENFKLQAQLAASLAESVLSQIIGEVRGEVGELYEGELLDRIRNAVAASGTKGFAVSSRDRAVMDAILARIQLSAFSTKILDSLKPASDPTQVDQTLKVVLAPLGFERSEQGKHIKFSPPYELKGIGGTTIAKTAGDHRSGDNAIRDVKAALGLRFADSD